VHDAGVLPGGRARDVFVGRDTERTALADLLARADRTGAVILVLGEPGIGKSALLDEAAATTSARVIRLRGTESETVIPFAGTADLLLPLHEHFWTLPAAQRRAVEVALSLDDGPPPAPLAVCAGALGVLSAAAETTPIAVMVDDFPWLDPESRQVITFLARRMPTERAVLVVAARSLPGQPPPIPHVPVLTLGGLGLDECRQLAERLDAPDPEQAAAVLLDGTGGNPLAIRETLARTGPGRGAIHTTVSIGPVLTRAWRAVLDQLPERTRLALFVAALGRASVLPSLPLALAALGLTVDDLSPAIADGLLHWDGGRAELRHPLLRQVLRESVPLADRHRVYLSIAPHASPEQQAWLLALEVIGPRDDLAEQLADAAASARGRGGYDSAAELLRRSADLTSDPARRSARVLEAASNAFIAGNVSRAAAWADDARLPGQDASFTAAVSLLRGQALIWMGHAQSAFDEFNGEAIRLAPTHPTLAAALMFDSSMARGVQGDVAGACAAARSGLDLAGDRTGYRGFAMAAASIGLTGDAAAVEHLLAEAERTADRSTGLDPLARVTIAMVKTWAEQFDSANVELKACVRDSRVGGAHGLLSYALATRSDLSFRMGRWPSSYADALESLLWGDELHQPGASVYGAYTALRIEAARGQRNVCLDRIARIRSAEILNDFQTQHTYLPAGAGLAALTVGDLDEAVDELGQAWAAAQRIGLVHPSVVPFGGDLAEAHARRGNQEAAAEVAAWLEGLATMTNLAYPAASAARCRGLLAKDPEEATEHFRLALRALERAPMPFEVARTLLAYGEMLRRHRRPGAARTPLLEAQNLFRGLGAYTWAVRCTTELAAAGVAPARSASSGTGIELLTPQELQVAREIAAGRSNPEAAEALFLSRKTVEAHLTRVYRKLGVRSRTELTRVLVESGMADD
jgi:DNA-binding CsgD family transcriptional regulator